MGLDMYAYVARKGQYNEYWEQYGEDIPEDKKVEKPRELAYWRKHPNLHGWMKQLWNQKGFNGEFNGVELELTWQDLEELERAVTHKQLPSTSGFFFGSDAGNHYYKSDLAFVKAAKAELFLGLQVFYNSSW